MPSCTKQLETEKPKCTKSWEKPGKTNLCLVGRNVTDIVATHTSVFQMSHPAYYALIHIPPDPKTAYLSPMRRKITFLRVYWRRRKGEIQFLVARAAKRYVRGRGGGRLRYCELLVPLYPPPTTLKMKIHYIRHLQHWKWKSMTQKLSKATPYKQN